MSAPCNADECLARNSGRAYIASMRNYAIGLMAAFCILAPAFAAPARKPWRFTVEERIALLTDPELTRERARRHEQSARVKVVDAFDGRTHPELFLPHELFRTLIDHAFLGPARSGDLFRRGFLPEVERHGLPSDFWKRLQNVSAVYIADAWAEVDLLAAAAQQTESGRKARETLRARQHDLCASRAAALAAARKEFGEETFDRFLYEGIAPGMFRVEDRVPDANVLRYVAGGCR